MQTLQRKVFVMYWEGPYEPKTEIHTEDWFTEDNGFKPEEIHEIAKMKIDETYKFTTAFLYKVWRVK